MKLSLRCTTALALTGSALLAGCLAVPDEQAPDESDTTAEITEPNGISLNGISLNGISLNGTTLNGISLNIYNRLGIQQDTQAWSVEANWTTEGATCIYKGRLGTAMTTPTVPQCMASRATVPCGTTLWPVGALIRTEVNR
jgi:hypothetical protein